VAGAGQVGGVGAGAAAHVRDPGAGRQQAVEQIPGAQADELAGSVLPQPLVLVDAFVDPAYALVEILHGNQGATLGSAVMSSRTVRVTVRGSFDQLTDQQRAELLAVAADHDFRFTQYTSDGHLSYDLAARPFFTFRFAETVEEQAQVAAVTARALAAAEAWLSGHGYGFKGLTAQTVDLSEVPLGKRGRREASRQDG